MSSCEGKCDEGYERKGWVERAEVGVAEVRPRLIDTRVKRGVSPRPGIECGELWTGGTKGQCRGMEEGTE